MASKTGGFTGNLTKLGGKGRKLSLKTPMKDSSMVQPSIKKAAKQAHKKV